MGPLVLENISQAVGATPLVRLRRLAETHQVECAVYSKCEFLNPGGSVKDRIALQMILEAERAGKLIPNQSVIVEASSGNTGIGLCMVAAARGYRVIVTISEKMSQEKIRLLRLLGATVVTAPAEEPFDSECGFIRLAQRIQRETPNAVILNQYENIQNPQTHQETTALELEEQMSAISESVKAIILGVGTGGTITGISKRLRSSKLKIVGVDPKGSIFTMEHLKLAKKKVPHCAETHHIYKVEGIGYDFIPKILDLSLIDEFVQVGDCDSFAMARDLIRTEGLLCGGSSGSVVQAAFEYCKKEKLRKEDAVVVLLADSVRNYLGTFASDDWMVRNSFLEPPAKSFPRLPGNWINSIGVELRIHSQPLSPAFCIDSLGVFPVLLVGDGNRILFLEERAIYNHREEPDVSGYARAQLVDAFLVDEGETSKLDFLFQNSPIGIVKQGSQYLGIFRRSFLKMTKSCL